MALANILHMIQATLYLLCCIMSIFVFGPMMANVAEFDGHCLLFARGVWSTSNITGESMLTVAWPSPSTCQFPIFTAWLGLVVGMYYLVKISITLYKGLDVSWLVTFIALMISCLLGLMFMVSGIIVTAGFKEWCNLVTVKNGEQTCYVAEFVQQFITDPTIYTLNYYIQFSVAQFGIWVCWICWAGIVAAQGYQLFRYHQQEDFLISLQRERTRLVHNVRPGRQYEPHVI